MYVALGFTGERGGRFTDLPRLRSIIAPHKHNVAGSQVVNNEPTSAGLLIQRVETAFGL